MLVAIPIGLWIFSFVCDLAVVFGSTNPAWPTVALYTMAGGVVGALLAAIPGLIDLLSLPAHPRKTAIAHMSINLTVVALYVVNLWVRWDAPGATGLPFWLSLIAIGLLVVSGWLGGKMVYELGVAVDDRALDPAARKA
jgi:uncharacterized membrane protein